jgi:bifunctional non-homologous end joining protein LigD
MARREGQRVRLLTRRGYDWTQRFRLIADAVASLRCRSCLIDGEAVACDDQGIKRRVASLQPNSTPLIFWKLTVRTCAASQLKRENERSSSC